jgi:hypothetical protein
MDDLRGQLAAKFGASAAAPPADPATAEPDPFGPAAHLDTDWVRSLRAFARGVGVQVPADAKLARCRQATDVTLKALKKSGRKRDVRALSELRATYLTWRERQAWSRVKSRFKDLNLSEKAYRALKQGGADGEKVWVRLAKLQPDDVRGVGAARLREMLGG